MDTKILVVAAHIGDFVWRSGGTIAKYCKAGAQVRLVVLSYGLRGETNAYWKQPGANLEEGKAIRRSEGLRAAELLGIQDTVLCDYEDYPIQWDLERRERLAKEIRAFGPDLILTHDRRRDLYNADHALIGEEMLVVASMASAAGAALDGLPPVKRPVIYGFEPHVAEISDFSPDCYVDITGVIETKKSAMAVYDTQKHMYEAYINRSLVRGQQSSKPGCRYAEAFSLHSPIFQQEFLIS